VNKMINEISRVLSEEDNFIVVTHVNPDGDAVGSLLGLNGALREMGKQSIALTGAPVPVLYDFLPGKSDIITDVSMLSNCPNWIISVDVAAEDRISADIKSFRNNARIINLDHHPTNPGFGFLNLVDPEATSTTEVIFGVLERTNYRLSKQVAKCLYTGLVTDTGCFRFSGVKGKTMAFGAALLDSGFDSYDITRHLYEEYPLSRFQLERIVLERMEILLDGLVMMSYLSYDDFNRIGADFSETENLVNKLREGRGIQVGVLITQITDEVVRVSLRSKGGVDVSSLAMKFGGGGHLKAAGFKSTLPLNDIRQRIIELIQFGVH
jgi:bifunctional oligoribonuclease and PAP phosphatase NrnA